MTVPHARFAAVQDDKSSRECRRRLLALVGFLGRSFFRGAFAFLLVLLRVLGFLRIFGIFGVLRVLRFFRILGIFGVLAPAIGRARARLFGVVGDVPARSLELHGWSGDHLLDRAAAFRAFLDRPIGKFPDFFETMTALLAQIFVKWHEYETVARCISILGLESGGVNFRPAGV